MAGKELKAKGYDIFAVHPEAKEIDGMICYPNLKSLSGKVDAVWISIPSRNVSPVLDEAAQIGLKNSWVQQGGIYTTQIPAPANYCRESTWLR